MTGSAVVAADTSSELLAQVRGDGRVVAHRLVETICLGPVMTGRDLDEGGPELAGHPLRLDHQAVTDAALARAGVDDQGQDAHDAVVVLEPRKRVERDEPEQRALVLRDDDARMLGREAAQSLDDVAGTGRVPLVREERRDGFGVARLRGSDRERRVGRLRHGSMVAGVRMSRNGPRTGWSRARSSGPNGPATPEPMARPDSHVTAQPS